MASMRPPFLGTRHMISAGHYLASQAGFAVLEAGGNAVDAGVAAGLCLGVVQSDLVNVAGVAPIIIRLSSGEVTTISGLGYWPKAVTPDLFQREHGGKIPVGLLRTVLPAAPDAWIAALADYGTMGFADVAREAIRLARDGFPMYPLMASSIAQRAEAYARWPENAAIYLPGGRPPKPGELFVQADLGRTLQYMADEEKLARVKGGRKAGLAAARDAFYKGDIAQAIAKYHRENGGLLTEEDLADYLSGREPAVVHRWRHLEVMTCGPWCQGPSLHEMLAILEGDDLARLGHNSPAYIHLLTEAIKLAFADRERYFTDPRFGEVPLDRLLSPDFARRRRAVIDAARAIRGLPAPGELEPRSAGGALPRVAVAEGRPGPSWDTSYVCAVDREGNVFSATPSDVSSTAPVIPGTGLVISTRGSQGWADPSHPCSVAPGKRPRLTPNPAIAVRDDGTVIPFGTPGGDVQLQAMLQVLLNVEVFGMDVQEAVEAPRFATYAFPDSFEPHQAYPDRLVVEGRVPVATTDTLARMGHDVERWPDMDWKAGAVCLIEADRKAGVLAGGADPRRPCYAIGA